MIDRISTSSVNNSQRKTQNQPQFKGLGGAALSLMQLCESQPMVNVAVLDLSTAIVPRTVIEGQTNPYAGLEAFRRESSGLIINCMIPGLIVAGIAKCIQPLFLGKGSNMAGCLADQNTIEMITAEWKEAEKLPADSAGKLLYKDDIQKARVYDTIKGILDKTRGMDGKEEKAFAGLYSEEQVKNLTDTVFKEEFDKKELDNLYKSIVEKTHISENIKIKGYLNDGKIGKEKYFTQNLESIVKNTPKFLKEILHSTKDAKISLNDFSQKAVHLLNTKSLMGMGVILPLAISAQPINRWITAKTSGKKGAPIYKDFTETESKELTPKEKKALFKQKLISVGSIVVVALLSMGGKFPNMSVMQYRKLFPTMDQARIISTATFASRMMASQDKNDLREATVRDIATFSSFYFLGDHVAKFIATMIQKAHTVNKKVTTGYELINELEPLKEGANGFEKLKHWYSKTALKSSSEVVGKTAERMRAVCQIGNLGFSLVALGLLIPMMNRKKTSKNRKEELKQMGIDQKTIEKHYPNFMKNSPNFAAKSNTYKAFFN